MRLRGRFAAAEAFRQLQILDVDAVPALIMLLDDNRPLALKNVAIPVDGPNAFESLAHQRLDNVFHAIVFLLSSSTGDGFGGSQANAISGWRIFLHHFDELKVPLKARQDGQSTRKLAELN